jgi:hypothetical protein
MVMYPHVEILLTGLIVAVAALVLLRRLFQFVRSAGAGDRCGTSCGKCAAQGDSLRQNTLQPLVPLRITSRDRPDPK